MGSYPEEMILYLNKLKGAKHLNLKKHHKNMYTMLTYNYIIKIKNK